MLNRKRRRRLTIWLPVCFFGFPLQGWNLMSSGKGYHSLMFFKIAFYDLNVIIFFGRFLFEGQFLVLPRWFFFIIKTIPSRWLYKKNCVWQFADRLLYFNGKERGTREFFFPLLFFFELGRTRCDRQTDELFLRTPLLLGDFLMSPDLSPSHLSFRLFCISR